MQHIKAGRGHTTWTSERGRGYIMSDHVRGYNNHDYTRGKGYKNEPANYSHMDLQRSLE